MYKGLGDAPYLDEEMSKKKYIGAYVLERPPSEIALLPSTKISGQKDTKFWLTNLKIIQSIVLFKE